MSRVVKLEDVVDAIDLPEEWESFFDPQTGEILTVTEEDRVDLDEEDNDAALEMPDWQRESTAKLKSLLDSGRALAVPGRFEIHEWELMKRFAIDVEDPDESTELLGAIHGTGAFRLFKATIARLGLRERWFEYRHEALREVARSWLKANGIQYVEEDEKESR